MFSRSLNQIICLWRNILKIIIIEISLKWIKFRGYLSVFSCILSTVWPKFLPLDLWLEPAPAARARPSSLHSSALQTPDHSCSVTDYRVTHCSQHTAAILLCDMPLPGPGTSAHRQAKKLKFVSLIAYAVLLIWHVLFVKWT